MSSKKSIRQASKRKSATTVQEADHSKAEKKVRSCSKQSCPAKAPICFARVASA